MSSLVDWEAIRQRGLNPPRRLLELRPHIAGVPPAIPSRLVPDISADTFHSLVASLRRANSLPPREAAPAYESALRTLTRELDSRPGYQGLSERVRYDPGRFTGNYAGASGLTDHRGNMFLNRPAFDSPTKLNLVLQHEYGHTQQLRNPPMRGNAQWTLRELGQHLCDLERRQQLGLTPYLTYNALKKVDAGWRRLGQKQRTPLQDRWDSIRRDVCQELRSTPYGSSPTYSRICGSSPFGLQFHSGALNIGRPPAVGGGGSFLRELGRGLYR